MEIGEKKHPLKLFSIILEAVIKNSKVTQCPCPLDLDIEDISSKVEIDHFNGQQDLAGHKR